MDAAQVGLTPATGPLRVGLAIASLETGGAQTMVLRLASALAARGHRVHLLCLDGGPAPALDGPAGALPPSVRVSFLSRGAPRGTADKILAAPAQCRALRRRIEEYGLHAVASFMERANIVNLLRGGPGARIVSIRSHPRALLGSKSPAKGALIRLLYPPLLRRADAVVLNSADSARGLADTFPLPPGKAVVIPNFCDTAALRSAGQRAPLPQDAALFEKPVILACGRLIRDKGLLHLVRAFAALGDRRSGVRLVMVGEGPLRGELEAAIDALGLFGQALLLGHRDDPLPLMARATLFCLPSLREGFPNALLEAMACGVPVLAADGPGGVAEILAPDDPPGQGAQTLRTAAHGLLAPALDGGAPAPGAPLSRAEKELGQGLVALLADPALRERMGQAAAARAAAFDTAPVLPLWEALLAQNAGGRP